MIFNNLQFNAINALLSIIFLSAKKKNQKCTSIATAVERKEILFG